MLEQITAPAGSVPTKAKSPKPQTHGLQYYDLKKNWTKKIVPHLNDKELNDILVEDVNIFTTSSGGKPFVHGEYPGHRDFNWRNFRVRRGLPPPYCRYVMYGACHWLVNFNLELAMLVEPGKPWRIVTSDKHSTVWDGAHTLFDFDFLAFDVPPQECFDLALDNGEILPPGRYRKTNTSLGFHNRTPDEIAILLRNEVAENKAADNHSETDHVPSLKAFLEHDAPLIQTHLATSRTEHSKVVNAVAAWVTLIYGEPHRPELDDEIANNLVEGFDIGIHTIRALKNGLNIMVKLNHLVEFDPWLAFERLGIVAEERNFTIH
jgi:hypothetical protein